MAASWKVMPEPEADGAIASAPPRRLDSSASRFFAVDLSGSTMGTIIKKEMDFVKTVASPTDRGVPWGSSCGSVAPAAEINQRCLGGTTPEAILKDLVAAESIVASDVWYLLTDGECFEVEKLCSTAIETAGVMETPIIFVIVGYKADVPRNVNISVGVSFFANAAHALIAFKDIKGNGELYVLAGKGCFAEGGVSETVDLDSWDSMKVLPDDAAFGEFCAQFEVPSPEARLLERGRGGIVDLGEEYSAASGGARVNVAELLVCEGVGGEDLERLLADQAFGALSLACKTRGLLGQLRTFLLAHKETDVTVRFEDVSGATELVAQLNGDSLSDDERKTLQSRLRDAHDQNRKHYAKMQEDVNTSPQVLATRRRNRLVDHAMQEVAELEQASFTADILARSSNRAKRATAVGDGDIVLSSLDLDAPAFRGRCQVCWGEDEPLSIAIRAEEEAPAARGDGDQGGPPRSRAAANTDNFTLDFPLAAGHFDCNDAISSQQVCFLCSTALDGTSLWHEPLAAIVPAFEFVGPNRTYMTQQLYLAFTGRLKMGVPFVSQLFMAVLSRTMRDKEWANKGLLEWMLENLMRNTPCRQTFSEQGEWTTYPAALAWAAEDFDREGVHSWVMRYPIAGFEQVLELGARAGKFSPETVAHMRAVKLLHLFASAYLAMLFRAHQKSDASVDAAGDAQDDGVAAGPSERKKALAALTHAAISIVYSRFHTQAIPVDLRGTDSLITSPDVAWERLAQFFSAAKGAGEGGDNDGDEDEDEDGSQPAAARPSPLPMTTAQSKVQAFLASWSDDAKRAAMPRVQLLAFWLAFSQKQHVRPGTFFTNLVQDQALASRLFKSPVGDGAALATPTIAPTLLSIFLPASKDADEELRAMHFGDAVENPFATPWGASVLRCCFPACARPFIDPAELPPRELVLDVASDAKLRKWVDAHAQSIRDARTRHLIHVFAADKSFEASQSGMPMPVATPTAPACAHVNLHSAMVREWARTAVAARREIVEAVDAKTPNATLDAFVRAVHVGICARRRGDVFNPDIARDVRRTLPSLVDALRRMMALKKPRRANGGKERDVAMFELATTHPTLAEKAVWELRLDAVREGGVLDEGLVEGVEKVVV